MLELTQQFTAINNDHFWFSDLIFWLNSVYRAKLVYPRSAEGQTETLKAEGLGGWLPGKRAVWCSTHLIGVTLTLPDMTVHFILNKGTSCIIIMPVD